MLKHGSALFLAIFIALCSGKANSLPTLDKNPRVVLVPGILGSYIKRCNRHHQCSCLKATDKECTIIWGSLFSLFNENLSYNELEYYDTEPLDEFAGHKFYNNIENFLRNVSADGNSYFPFSYDWRISATANASRLGSYLCEIQTAAPGAPLYIIGHSMGGLIIRRWLYERSDLACANKVVLNVKEIAYVGTPHLGSVQSFATLLTGFKFLFLKLPFSDDINGAIFSTLNKSGVTFESVYELFPPQASSECQKIYKDLSLLNINSHSPVQIANSSKGINIFSPITWTNFPLIKKVKSISKRDDPNLVEIISKNLANSENFICNLMKETSRNKAKKLAIKEMYYFGYLENASTLESVILKITKQGDIEIENLYGRGDGTVLAASAKNLIKDPEEESQGARDRFANRAQLPLNHLDLINSDSIAQHINSWIDNQQIIDIKLTPRKIRFIPRKGKQVPRKKGGGGAYFVPVVNPVTNQKGDKEDISGLRLDRERLFNPKYWRYKQVRDIIADISSVGYGNNQFDASILTIENRYSLARYLVANNFSEETKTVAAEFLARYFYYIAHYDLAREAAEYYLNSIPQTDYRYGSKNSKLAGMLILSGWASLHLGEVSIAEERFASVRRVVRSSRAQAEGIDASNNFRRGLDWEESSDFLRNLSDLSRMMTVMDFKRDNDIEQDRLSLVKLCLKSSFCKSLVDRHLRYVEDQTGEIRRRLISELKKTLKEKGLLSEEMEKKIREIEESFNR